MASLKDQQIDKERRIVATQRHLGAVCNDVRYANKDWLQEVEEEIDSRVVAYYVNMVKQAAEAGVSQFNFVITDERLKARVAAELSPDECKKAGL